METPTPCPPRTLRGRQVQCLAGGRLMQVWVLQRQRCSCRQAQVLLPRQVLHLVHGAVHLAAGGGGKVGTSARVAEHRCPASARAEQRPGTLHSAWARHAAQHAHVSNDGQAASRRPQLGQPVGVESQLSG